VRATDRFDTLQVPESVGGRWDRALVHKYALHRPVDATCLCCELGYRSVFKSSSDSVICPGCSRHQGSTLAKLTQREQDHRNLYKSELALVEEKRKADVADVQRSHASAQEEAKQLREEVSDLRGAVRSQVGQRPVETIAAWLESEQIAAAVRERDAAYRSRDRAIAVIWQVSEAHLERDSRTCSCGQSRNRCAMFQAVDPIRPALNSWESKQVQRYQAGREHGLPDNHPVVLKGGRRGRLV
jgi:hypothetical protein